MLHRNGPRLIGNHVTFDVEFHTKLFLEEPEEPSKTQNDDVTRPSHAEPRVTRSRVAQTHNFVSFLSHLNFIISFQAININSEEGIKTYLGMESLRD